ncbi:MAG: hypothetical protein HY528_02965, partial [Chloroflexi bacterium]|nr:hypothetical protein [Chloroflexota bacterium]
NITSDLTTAVTKEIDLAEKEGSSSPGAKSNEKTKEPSDSGTAETGNTETTHHSH